MASLTDIYQTINAKDAELLEKQAEVIKRAEEEDAAGRIMARGFADELAKLAWQPGSTVPDTSQSLGAMKNFKVGPKGATGMTAGGQQMHSTATGAMAPTKPAMKPPAAPKPPGQ